MFLIYISPFIIAFLLTVILVPLIRKLAVKKGILDKPNQSRKIHTQATPLLGGLAIWLAFSLVILFYIVFTDRLLGGYMLFKYLLGIIIAGGIIMVGGYLDDRYRLAPRRQMIWPILAVLVIIVSGIGIKVINNPFGGLLYLDKINLTIFIYHNLPYQITLWADLLAFVWLLGMIYTTKFLDGLDGLVSGIGVIGSLIIFCFSLSQQMAQPETALLALIFAGCCAGFLVFNWQPARIFLGEGGSLLIGLMLGVLAIISGAKIATALLIMGIPILDVVWVIIRRLFFEHRSLALADKKHLHFRLLDIGLSHRQTVLTLYFLTAVFGGMSLFLQTQGKLWALGVLFLVTVVLGAGLVLVYRYKRVK